MKEEIRRRLINAGALAVGFAQAGEISPEVHKEYQTWIEEGHQGEMSYLERHLPLRQHTDNVLKEARTVISMAFGYAPKEWQPKSLPVIAVYAYGEDYHLVLREILNPVVKEFQKEYGGKWRICIDSAPMAERFWAVKSGIAKRGINGSVIIHKGGSLCFLVEILTTQSIEADHPSKETFG